MYDLISTINHGPTSCTHRRSWNWRTCTTSPSISLPIIAFRREGEREREADWKALDDLSYLDGIVEIRREKTLASALRRWLNSTLTFDAICEEVNRNDTVRWKSKRSIPWDLLLWLWYRILVHGWCFICLAADSPRIQRNPLRNSDTKHVPHI